MQSFAPAPFLAFAQAASPALAHTRLAEPCKLLIIEGRRGSLCRIETLADYLGYRCTSVTTLKQAFQAISDDADLGIAMIEAEPQNPHGSRLLERLPAGSAIVPIVAAEAPTMPQAISVLQLGARDLLSREAPLEQVAKSLRIAAEIRNKVVLRGLGAPPCSRDGAPPTIRPARTSPLQRLKHEIEMLDARQTHFDRIALDGRTWRILLELAAARMESRRVTVSTLARSMHLHTSAISQSIARLVHVGAVKQRRSSADRRNVFLTLGEPIVAEILSACDT